MKRLIFTFFLMSFSVSVYAEWTFVDNNSVGDKFYVDLSTLKSNGNIRKVWYKTIFNSPNEYGDLSSKVQSEYDCKNDTHRIRYLVTFSDVDLINISASVNNSDNTWIPVVPESVDEIILKLVCKRK